MAAIIPHLETQKDPSATIAERALWTGTGNSRPGVGYAMSSHALSKDVLDRSHAELTQTAWVRQAAMESLLGRTYEVRAGDVDGKNKREVFLVLDKPVGTAPLWNPPGTGDARQFRLLSWTSKMGCPSFSLPAGPLEAGGACPGASAGQSIVPVEALRAGAQRVQRVTGETVRLDRAVCQFCYAEGGRYATSLLQYGALLRYIWARRALSDGSFVDVLRYAIAHAEFFLDGGTQGGNHYERETHPGRYFRLHDSGDFFSAEYLMAWRAVADAFPDITFWAPTRIWATSWGVDAVNEINHPARHIPNLVIRPSAYMVGSIPPRDLGPGWSKGTAVLGPSEPLSSYFECGAYRSDEPTKSCRNSIGPDGRLGCRACWRHGHDLEIAYRLH